ncbi:RES family NAD+ phosphorylase [Actinomadura sp. DC4]|uniref:RES family NAD+ phosphorylase n=1 Tax=Actinomadura sp. DC4 TaxID=3055069 RepID=UPI0025AF7C87|nr:RES family NAD+ phosphorylase [Actinomadura sp. DC4]MDN3353859.1 RES family NAD+ phosphorylase [Actinomadura sp. DC4]
MVKAPPPARFAGTPLLHPLPVGTRLWRVHDRRVEPTAFTERLADGNFGGGRFDATAHDPFPYYYAGLKARTALAEVLLRDIVPDARGVRTIHRPAVRDRRSSVVRTTTGLKLVSLLTGPALAAIAQDTWLIHADTEDYHATRRWASWIRRQAPDAHGLIWPSKREGRAEALMLFGDRCEGVLEVDSSSVIDLDDVVGAEWINALLAPYRAWISHPRRR